LALDLRTGLDYDDPFDWPAVGVIVAPYCARRWRYHSVLCFLDRVGFVCGAGMLGRLAATQAA
jgi:hypothetical protein